jgi:hypothetical protein
MCVLTYKAEIAGWNPAQGGIEIKAIPARTPIYWRVYHPEACFIWLVPPTQTCTSGLGSDFANAIE